MKIRKPLAWSPERLAKHGWLSDLVDVPADAAPPLAMSPPHRRAVGSYGWEAIEWIEANVPGVKTLRWWQKLSVVRQLEHDRSGALVWRTILESTPRRAGKSVRLRGMALWRIAHADLIGEEQLVLHTGRDLAIVREIHRRAWAWAATTDGWAVRKGVGQEEVSRFDDEGEHRWLVRSVDSVYGYDVCNGMVDEAWDVSPATVEEGLEPAMLERLSPQLLLTSTAHRRATSLMRKRLSQALAKDDGETLLMLWGAPPGADESDPETWKAASPHWSEDRRKMIASKYAKAIAGELDAEADDPDPVEGWRSQYLNRWQLKESRAAKGKPLVGDEWDTLLAQVPDRRPDAVAIESWFADGVSVVRAWKDGSGVLVSASDHRSLSEAAEALQGHKGRVLVGATLADDPALKRLRVQSTSGRTAACVKDLDRLLSEHLVRHDGGAHLTEQMKAIRTVPGADGLNMASKSRADAVKAAAWAATAARTRPVSRTRVVLPSGARKNAKAS